MIADLIFGLADKLVDKVVEKTGADRVMTYEAVMLVLKDYVDAERKAVTDERAKAVKRVRGR